MEPKGKEKSKETPTCSHCEKEAVQGVESEHGNDYLCPTHLEERLALCKGLGYLDMLQTEGIKMTQKEFDLFKKYQVNDASSVQNFLKIYYRPDRMSDTLVPLFEQEFNENGFCFISKHDSIVGEIVSYYGSK